MNKVLKKYKAILVIVLIIFIYLVFRPKYSGYGQKCECLGYKRDRIDESHLNIVDPETLQPLIRETEIVTTTCYGIPYQCELNTGYEILDSSSDLK